MGRVDAVGRVVAAVVLGLLSLGLLVPAVPVPQARAAPVEVGSSGVWPLPGPRQVLRGFEPPTTPWGAGNRGLDLAGVAGSPVRAVAEGTVSFAGQVGGQPVVVVTHGALRTTYTPVRAEVAVGARVSAGDRIGRLEGSHCPDQPCLHLGLLAGEDYLDPSVLFTTATTGRSGRDDPVRLLPEDVVDQVRRRAAQRRSSGGSVPGSIRGGAGAHGFVLPVVGPISSGFGMRTHPVTGVHKLHDGTDLAASCGTPVVAPADGVVRTVDHHPALGLRVVIDHGEVAGRQVQTGLNHLSAQDVTVGQRVVAGQLVGAVGTTGWSTGCHLHLMVWLDGQVVDPMTWF